MEIDAEVVEAAGVAEPLSDAFGAGRGEGLGVALSLSPLEQWRGRSSACGFRALRKHFSQARPGSHPALVGDDLVVLLAEAIGA